MSDQVWHNEQIVEGDSSGSRDVRTTHSPTTKTLDAELMYKFSHIDEQSMTAYYRRKLVRGEDSSYKIPLQRIRLEAMVHDERTISDLLRKDITLFTSGWESAICSKEGDSWARTSRVIVDYVETAIKEISRLTVKAADVNEWHSADWGNVSIAVGGLALRRHEGYPQEIYSGYRIMYDGQDVLDSLDDDAKIGILSLPM